MTSHSTPVLEAADGHRLGSFRADPEGESRGGIVVVQEIFGVNSHIRNICKRLAEAGYTALAPAIFDRIEPDFQSGYSKEEVEVARSMMPKLEWENTEKDVAAAIKTLAAEGPVAVVGFCLGGSLAFTAATRPGLAAAVCFYGGRIVNHADKPVQCPTQMHFGETDHSIPLADVETIREKRPDCEIHVYPAGHGFNCDERASYDPDAAALAWKRTLAFLEEAFDPAKPAS